MADHKKYRIAKDIVIPKGTKVLFVSKMNQAIVEAMTAVVGVGKDMHFDWIMYREDALESGLVEEIEDGVRS
jgi:hypothetical protein